MNKSIAGFTGPRDLAPRYRPLVVEVVRTTRESGRLIATGCAYGADQFVRTAAPGAIVYDVASGKWGHGRGRYAARSTALVRAVVRYGGPRSCFVGFVSSPCPDGITPARSWRSGSPPSGSWSSLALAVGMGLPVSFFWCAPGPPVMPAWHTFAVRPWFFHPWSSPGVEPVIVASFSYRPAQIALF